MKKLILAAGLLAASCTAVPAFAGTPVPFRMIVQAQCPSGAPFQAAFGADRGQHFAQLVALLSGATTVQEFLAWVEKNDPETLAAARQAIMACFAERPKDA